MRELRQGSATAVARACGIHRSTTHRWMQQDNWELHLATFFQIQRTIQSALTRLGALILDPTTTLRIYQCFAALLPVAPTTNSAIVAVITNLPDPTTPDPEIYIGPAAIMQPECDKMRHFDANSANVASGTAIFY